MTDFTFKSGDQSYKISGPDGATAQQAWGILQDKLATDAQAKVAAGVHPVEAAIGAEGVTDPNERAFIGSLHQQESSGRSSAPTSNAGASGPMQVIPKTFAGVAEPGWTQDSDLDNSRAGVRYAREAYAKAGGDPKLAAAYYYGGPGGMAKAQQGVAVADPRNPQAPNTLQYGEQVASRLPRAITATSNAAPATTDDNVARVEVRGTSDSNPQTVPPPEQPGILSRTLAAAGTKEGWQRFAGGAMDTVRDLPDALTSGAAKLGANVVGPVEDLIGGDKLGTHRASINADATQYAKDRGANTESAGFQTAEAVPEMLATGGPIAGAGKMVASRLPQAIGRLAPVVGDVIANAGYSAGKEAAGGGDVGDVVKAGAEGAGGAAVGHTVATVLGGLKSALPKAMQTLTERGGLPSAGQMLGGVAQSAENAIAKIPIVGKVLGARGAIDDAAQRFTTADVNRALEPIGKSVTSTGQQAVTEGVQHANDLYAKVIPQTRIGPRAANKAVLDALTSTLGAQTPSNASRWHQALQIVNDETKGMTGTMKWTDGSTAKTVDSRLGELERWYADHPDPQMKDISKVLRQTKQNLRDALTPVPGAPNSVLTDLQNANKARAQLYPLEDAATGASGNAGHFSANDSFQAQAKSGRAPLKDAVNAQQRAIDNAGKANAEGTSTAAKAALGTAALTLGFPHMSAVLSGAAAGSPLALLGATGLAGGGTVARLANTVKGRKLLLNGMAGGLPADSPMRKLLQSAEAAQAAGQVGREAATQ